MTETSPTLDWLLDEAARTGQRVTWQAPSLPAARWSVRIGGLEAFGATLDEAARRLQTGVLERQVAQ